MNIQTMEASAATPTTVDVAIIGGGIGGLAAAVALRKAGFDAHVFERTKVLREVGGAVLIREPSVKLFEEWGIGGQFRKEAVQISLIDILNPDGRFVRSVDADRAHDGESFSVHRSDVHGLLLGLLPDGCVHLGKECTNVTVEPEGGKIDFRDGTHTEARVVIGADGIKSRIRRLVSDDEMMFSGLVVLRGLAPVAALPQGLANDRITMWGRGEHMMVLLPLRGGREVAMDTVIEQNDPPTELWTSEVTVEALTAVFAGFAPPLLNLIRAGTVPVRANPVYDREPIPNWSVGQVTLMGDAAHPMAPRMGQGANMAIQDAGAFAEKLAANGLGKVKEAIDQYQQQRIGPSTAMQLASREKPGSPADAA